MSSNVDSAKGKLGTLSKEKARLLRLLLQQRSASTQAITPCPRLKNNGSVRLPASWAQQRLWFIDQLEDGGAAYHVAIALRLRGTLDEEATRSALDAIVQRHEVLRTAFVSVDGELHQEVVAQARLQLKVIELSAHEQSEREAQIRQHKYEECQERFDLRTAPLIRGRLLRISSREHVLLITMHHTVSDGWSLGVFFDEFTALYGAYSEGREHALEPLPIQYGDYAHWHRQRMQGEIYDKQLEHWRASLLGAPPQIDLPADRSRPPAQSYRGEHVRIVLDAVLSGKLRAVAQQHEMTLFMVLNAAFTLLLSRLSGQDDVVVGTPVANRPHAEVERLIGFFVNTLALRVVARKDMPLRDFLAHVREVTIAAYAHQDVPFEKIVEALRPQRSLSRNPIFQVMFALQNAPGSQLRLPGLTVSVEDAADESALFDLLLVFEERGEEIIGKATFAADLFDRATVDRWMESLTVLMKGMSDRLDTSIGELPILPQNERRQIIELFNATRARFPQEKLVHELFEAQVDRTPQAVAVEHEGTSLTYAELNARANQLAHYVREQGTQTGECIPICMPRSLQMLIAQLAVLKAGGVYVPLDPTLPVQRQAFMIADCGARRVLAEGVAHASFKEQSVQWVDCADAVAAIARHSTDNLRCQTGPRPAAYVMYTSGSTGTPKGVVVPHRAVNRLVINGGYAQIEPTDCIAHCSNPAFDASTFEIWGALLNAARVLIVPQSVVLDAGRFAEVLHEHRVTVLFLTVGLFTQYTDALASVFRELRYLITGGDVVEPAVVRRVLRKGRPRHLLNAYGPTECTTFSTTFEIEAMSDDARSVPIGRPISNTEVYILDSLRNPVPIGVIGELHIGGPGVALGYMNRPELTAERFIPDPFGTDEYARLYRTGDLGRWRADGNIDFIGRNDQQVKIRGYRIELGEIEALLLQHPQVREAIVQAREDVPAQKRLAAYITRREESGPSAEELRTFLKAELPEYMVPSAFVMLERLPLTANGKVDRRALPAPQLDAYANRAYEAPRGEVEQVLARVWQDLLRVERVGRQDNFFELGGHSLLMVQMIEQLRRAGQSAEARSIYESSTLAGLARTLVGKAVGSFDVPGNLIPAGSESITPQMLSLVKLEPRHIARIVEAVPDGATNIQDIYPLAPLQEGILFHHLLDERGVDPYVLPRLLSLPSREKLDAFIRALQAVIQRHDVLRTAVLWEQLPQPIQVVYRHATLPVEEIALTRGLDAVAQMRGRMTVADQRLNLRQAPLMRLQVAADPGGDRWYVLLHMHHVVCDQQSHDLMFTEVVAHMQGHEDVLPAPVPYRNHVAQTLALSRIGDAEAFFRTKLGDVEEPTAPFGLIDVHAGGVRIHQAKMPLAPVLATRVRTLARRLAVSSATLFHATWALVLAHTSARNDVVFGSVLLGRLQGSAGAQQTLGMFINTLPLRLKLANVTAKELVHRTQRELAELFNYEQASLAVAQRCSGISGSSSPFNTLFNYRYSTANFDADLATSGVTVLAQGSWTNYPIMLAVDDLGEGFALSAKTDTRIDPQRILQYVATSMQSLVDALESATQTPALALSILPESEQREVIWLFNATESDFPRDKLISELFEEQVERTPKAVAVEYEGRSLTYAELNAKANQLARYLRDKAVVADQIVGICLERGLDMVVGLLGILKAGAAYMPLDPNYPTERLQFMLEDAAPRIVLTQHSLQAALPAACVESLVLDGLGQELAAYSSENLSAAELGLNARNVLYVIYTSGSTGRPKGIEMSHGSMVNLIEWHRKAFPNSEGTRVLQFAALSFDVAFQETFSTLCMGGTLVMLDEWVRRDARALLDLLRTRSIGRLFVPPLMLESLAESLKTSASVPTRLRDIITAGEQLRINAETAAFIKRLHGCRLHNHYGPTETHVVTALTLTGDPEEWPELPSIGRPISNTQIYILNAQRQAAPLGVVGEIYVGGANVARGYRGRSELTAQRFLPDPFADDPRARMYKTGDLGRWRPDGTLEYLGRNDDQVKIRGYRVELGEVEGQLARHAWVKDAAVIAREDVHGEKRLVAYLTKRDCLAPQIEELRAYMQTLLPEHMVPSAFVVLEKLPLTPSGKLDRRALPVPDLDAYAIGKYEPPQGELEQAMAAIWQGLLRVARVGRTDNFFELGGHSLLAMKLVAQVTERLQVNLTVPAVFRCPTVQQMAQLLESSHMTRETPSINQGAELEEGFI